MVVRKICNYIGTSHRLAKVLLSDLDDFITVSINGEEYMIENVKTVKTHANIDDRITHKTLVCKKMSGNLR